MGESNIFISSPCKLSIKNENLLLHNRDSDKEVFVALDNVSSIVVDNPICTFTHRLLDTLAQKNILLITCDKRHLPSGIFLPLLNHSTNVLHIRKQIKLSAKSKEYLWQKIIQTKLLNSSKVLEFLDKENATNLANLAHKVLLNDKSNIEAFGARMYFSALFSSEFKRRDPSIINAMLNYGYAIVRANIARSLCAKGLLTSLGIFHDNMFNQFNLADDLLEPFRAFVDIAVYKYLENIEYKDELEKQDKLYLLQILHKEVKLKDKHYECNKAIDELANSYLRVVLNKSEDIALPILDKKFMQYE